MSSADSPLTLSQRIYIIAGSLRSFSDWLRLVLLFNLFFLSLGWAQDFYGFDLSCICINIDDTYHEFVYLELSFVTVALLLSLLVKGPGVYKKLKVWREDYLEETYTIIFDTIIPKGSTTGERIFNLARVIFPELTSDYVSSAASIPEQIGLYLKKKLGRIQAVNIAQGLNYRVNSGYSADLALKLPLDGFFIVKDFEEKAVTIEDLKYLVEMISGKFKDKYQRTAIFRTICVARNYDDVFLNRNSLEKIMTKELKANFKIDLIVEEKVGYSVLWIS